MAPAVVMPAPTTATSAGGARASSSSADGSRYAVGMAPRLAPDHMKPFAFPRPSSLEALNALSTGTAMESLGIVLTELGPDFLRGTMPVDARTLQPYGLLHGGASVLLAETLGSSAANLTVPEGKMCVGIEINANHVRGVRSGTVTGTARPVHVGARDRKSAVEGRKV